MNIIFQENFLSKIEGKHLLLDTSFFIDATINQTNFQKIIQKLKDNGNILVTTDIVKAEFLKGTEIKNREIKENLMTEIVDSILTTTPDIINKYIHLLSKKYGTNGRGISIGDLLIGATLQRYPNDLLLVTKNPKDFPKPTTKLITYFLMDKNKALQIYAFLSKSSK